jgi:hypothetical protein
VDDARRIPTDEDGEPRGLVETEEELDERPVGVEEADRRALQEQLRRETEYNGYEQGIQG